MIKEEPVSLEPTAHISTITGNAPLILLQTNVRNFTATWGRIEISKSEPFLSLKRAAFPAVARQPNPYRMKYAKPTAVRRTPRGPKGRRAPSSAPTSHWMKYARDGGAVLSADAAHIYLLNAGRSRRSLIASAILFMYVF